MLFTINIIELHCNRLKSADHLRQERQVWVSRDADRLQLQLSPIREYNYGGLNAPDRRMDEPSATREDRKPLNEYEHLRSALQVRTLIYE